MLDVEERVADNGPKFMELSYYILMVRCGLEYSACKELEEKGFTAVCPTYKTHRKIRHRKSENLREVIKPVIDGYLFVETSSVPDLNKLKKSANVLKVVSFAGVPAKLSSVELEGITGLVESLRLKAEQALDKELGIKRWPKDLKPGEPIRIVNADTILMGVYLGGHIAEVQMFGGSTQVKIVDSYVERMA